jgi:hypothetical protein
MFNPSTYVGMLKLLTIAGRVVAGRKLRRQRLSDADAG